MREEGFRGGHNFEVEGNFHPINLKSDFQIWYGTKCILLNFIKIIWEVESAGGKILSKTACILQFWNNRAEISQIGIINYLKNQSCYWFESSHKRVKKPLKIACVSDRPQFRYNRVDYLLVDSKTDRLQSGKNQIKTANIKSGNLLFCHGLLFFQEEKHLNSSSRCEDWVKHDERACVG